MPVRKSGEAHRALELLEEYHAELNRPSDVELKVAIEKVISIFKSNLFQALCDIQEFYDNTLLNERVPFPQKTQETRRLAERWEQHPPFGRVSGLSYPRPGLLDQTLTNGDSTSYSRHSYERREERKELTKDGWLHSEESTRVVDAPDVGHIREHTASSGLVDDQGREWEVEDVILEKNQTGLGFSISGGKDRGSGPDHYIRVTDISPGGAVARDARVRKDDIILKVNNVDCVDVEHQIAVEALKNSGSVVRLLVKRLKPLGTSPKPLGGGTLQRSPYISPNVSTGFPSYTPPQPIPPPHSPASSIPIHRTPSVIQRLEQAPGVRKLELFKGSGAQPKGLGFSIAGGIGNEHYPNDTGIFVTRIIEGSPAAHDGRLESGDQILAVDNTVLENVTHQFAVETLKATGNLVRLLYKKKPYGDLEAARLNDSTTRSIPDQSFGSQSHLSYQPQPYVQPEISTEPRAVTLRKGDGGLGFNIVGGEDGEPIYISHVLPGGVADLSGNVRKGDVLLRVNDTELARASHNDAALALKACPPNSYVQLILHYRPQEYQNFEDKVERLRNDLIQRNQTIAPAVVPAAVLPPRHDFYVRALFDNDVSRDTSLPHRSLSFHYGDILHVINATDDDWWTARRVAENGDEGAEGVIPSKKRVEKRERQRRKQVNFNGGSQSLGRNASMSTGLEGRRGSRSQLSFSRKFPFVKSTEKLNEYTDNELGGPEDPIFSYEPVVQQQVDYIRPVIILGAMKDRINDELVSRMENTSRPPREGEIHGRDYYFVSKTEMERDVKNNLFIEAGQFQNNLYGTSIEAVREVARTGRHCILDVSGNAIRRLQNTANIYPIAIFVKPYNHHQLREWDPSLTDEEAFKQFERCQRQEQQFGDLFTTIVTGHTPEDVIARVIQGINEHSRSRIWVPSRQPLF
ncbi:disks large 3-like [Aphelenchoides avenae]|nr:disks large 3-like [Aphelenchus avenae]